MVIKETEETRIIKYNIENPAFKGVEFSARFDEGRAWPALIKFAAKQGGILWSAREAGAFTIEEGRKDKGNLRPNDYLYQATRTVVIEIKIDGKFYQAIDDTVNPEQNIVIARAQAGYESHYHNGKYLLPVTDPLVKGALLRAEKTGRIVELTENYPHAFKTGADSIYSGMNRFDQDDLIKAILLDMAEPYAQMLKQHGYDHGFVRSLIPQELEKMGVDGNFVEVRLVQLGYHSNYDYGHGVATCVQLAYTANNACGVYGAREFSTDDKIVKLDEKVSALIREICT